MGICQWLTKENITSWANKNVFIKILQFTSQYFNNVIIYCRWYSFIYHLWNFQTWLDVLQIFLVMHLKYVDQLAHSTFLHLSQWCMTASLRVFCTRLSVTVPWPGSTSFLIDKSDWSIRLISVLGKTQCVRVHILKTANIHNVNVDKNNYHIYLFFCFVFNWRYALG